MCIRAGMKSLKIPPLMMGLELAIETFSGSGERYSTTAAANLS